MQLLLCTAVLFSIFLLVTRYNRRNRLSLPPGPLGLPLIGNLLDMTKSQQWRGISEWREKYGDIVYLRVFGKSFVYLRNAEVATDLLHSRGSIYSDRPHLTMAGEMCGMKNLVPLTRYGPRFRQERKLMSSVLSNSAVGVWKPAIMKENAILLRSMLETPADYSLHIRRMAGSLALSAMYGYQAQGGDDPYVKGAEEFMRVSSDTMTRGWLVDFIPLLKHIPMTTWRTVSAHVRAQVEAWVDRPNTMFKNLPNTTEKVSSFCGQLLLDENGRLANLDAEESVKWMALSIYGGMSQTYYTVATISQMILAMVHHPDVVKKAHTELDEVVGQHRLPTFDDQNRLPYIDCILRETLRWGTPVPLSPPHVLMEQDEYLGYTLPEGSYVIPRAIMHDTRVFSDPQKFYPERFEEVVDPELGKLRDPLNYVFGFGRRRCPGVHFAMQSIWYTIATFLTCFDISPIVGEDNVPALPALEFEDGVFRHPKPFRFRLSPRGPLAEDLIHKSSSLL
ncbi:hypothetical protein PHLGIDRAFT_25923 [Phlebiopsis gigantea 11061_1 CR5-6]|uniref:Cytochrome P450 n=1 Tax=Phlebiopsis gigantea (strain 11061_1 CR5-6) TaxID=745531 RepID=A0A0C3RT95_PHLG1|nr:hypothetical protein PHLGIDRAFT_25923 [Phlebiopsis gigantea 11061_1 CR5-6]